MSESVKPFVSHHKHPMKRFSRLFALMPPGKQAKQPAGGVSRFNYGKKAKPSRQTVTYRGSNGRKQHLQSNKINKELHRSKYTPFFLLANWNL